MSATQLIKTHVHAGDVVKVISGNHRGSEGKILQVIPAKSQVIIEGVRMIKKHLKRSQEQPNGAIIEREGPIHISNVKLLEKKGSSSADTSASKGGKPVKAKVAKTPKATKAAKVE
ncbi:MAG: 50S ribosomal protein L24 [Verrucomicrobia bacterium]|nr:50S ribosomal protein L24 [Verrucomicrobiota bacterium]